ncbi:protein DDI1 homolog 2 [Eurytemora carolleeae]|uniref:protein DDI1 homolog 2 n=1 Tax=Eurytemora carolleeae TaxID=1294199 RepID=UPI000C783272|nr:protein DDI1 homolog 2 [Eurytemora carolleeae]|eukprot:XP_023326271.1 protein DDI1 homolog 2-like [Eurytemora affinis]
MLGRKIAKSFLKIFQAFCEIEAGIPSTEIGLLFNGIPLLENSKTLAQYGIKDGDMIVLDRIRPRGAEQQRAIGGGGLGAAVGGAGGLPTFDFSRIQIPTNLGGGGGGSRPAAARNEEDPAFIREMLSANPDQLALLKQNNPRLAEAHQSGNLEEFAKVLREQQAARRDREQQRIRMMNADPFDLEAQQLIAREIAQKNIDANMELAMENSPESFGSVIMLYINCRVNGHDVKAFVDSGAQATIMSQKAAERCNIMRLVDQRWAGIAKGVGTQKIIGRVHMVQIQIEKDFLTSSFSILEDQPMDMLLGLDMLKRHQCILDLKKGVLHIGTTGTETPFLPEAELPACARLSSDVNEEDVIKASAKESAGLEDRQLAEALARSASEVAMDTSLGAGPSGASAVPSVPASQDSFPESDVQNLMKMGFSRENSLIELRKFNGDVNQAIAALFAKSLSESFGKRK